MTTPRDDIAGLSERLREQVASDHVRGCQGRQYTCDCGYDLVTEGSLEQAATQLDSLLKERDSLNKELAQTQAHLGMRNCDLEEAVRERDALQARVKELESGIAHAHYRSDNCDAENQSLYNRLEAVESRALRAEQERDELEAECSAYASQNTNLRNDLVLVGMARDSAEQERDEAYERLKPFAEASDSLDESHLDRMDLWESPSAMDITAGHLRAARDLVRRLAGPEKEKKG